MRVWPALRLSGLAIPAPGSDISTGELLQAALSDHPVAAIEETSDDEWLVFFTGPDDRDVAGTALGHAFPAVSFSHLDVPDQDWAARSQASLSAIRVGRVIVAPPWDAQPVDDMMLIVIQPSMGFGTGHHATTRLCLDALQRTALTGRRVLDVGTGSGVLAIAASLLGASDVHAIDDDADALQAAGENLELNPGTSATFTEIDLRHFAGAPFEVVTANLTGGLLITASAQLERLTAPGGTLILSGLMIPEAQAVEESFAGSTVTRRVDEDEWVCLTLKRKAQA